MITLNRLSGVARLFTSICLREVGEATGAGSVIPFLASTAGVDRMSDIVVQNWDLDAYKRNPVVLWGHDYQTPPVGRAATCEVEADGLAIGVEFDEDANNPLGQLVARQVRSGFLSAVSVGFRPHSMIERASLSRDDPRRADRGMILDDNELLELSIVTVPANAQALVGIGRAAEGGANDLEEIEHELNNRDSAWAGFFDSDPSIFRDWF